MGEAILRGHCRDYNNNRVYVSSTAWLVGRSGGASMLHGRHSPLVVRPRPATTPDWRIDPVQNSSQKHFAFGALVEASQRATDLSNDKSLKILSMSRSTFKQKVL